MISLLSTELFSPAFVRCEWRSPFRWAVNINALFLGCFAFTGALSGCGGSTTAPKASPIAMISASGVTATASALSLGSKLTLSMTPSADGANAGVDWVVTCGGNPVTGSITNGACGTLSPAHTGDGTPTVFTAPSTVPIGTTVTITAAVTSNPSQRSSATLTILAVPITVQFYGTTPPSSLETNKTDSLAALVTNDPIGDGVIWTATCSLSSCGSFSPQTTSGVGGTTTYTAPSAVPTGDTVTIVATSLTDTTKSASATVTITPSPVPPASLPISLSILPASIYVQQTGQNRSARLTAIVSNDSSGAGVDWSLNCSSSTSNCGSITTHTSSGVAATFTNSSNVPVSGTITITAKSTADPTKTAAAVANVVSSTPIAITLSTTASLPATMNTGSAMALAASVSPSSNTSGVNWSASCGSTDCGSFSLSPAHTVSGSQIVYIAPATVPTGSTVTITAASGSTSPSNSAVAVTTIIAAPPPTPTIAFEQTPPASLVSGTQFSIAADVANDVAPGGVKWTVQCGSSTPGGCGWFVPNQTASAVATVYTAPPVNSSGTSVTITATSVTDSKVSISSGAIAINPDSTLKVNFIPALPSQVQPNTTISLNAAVQNDSAHAGVDWQVCASGCGYFTIKSGTPAIDGTATTPPVASQPPVIATSVSGWPSGLPISYTAPTEIPATGSVAVIASAHGNASIANSGTISITSVLMGPALNGLVKVGTQPVVGASVALYLAGTNGYGSISAPIASVSATDKNGGFTLPADYNCPQANSQMYLVTTGGKAGGSDPNPNLLLMTVLGSCNSLSSTPIVVNEATSVASAFAAAPFAADDALTGNNSYLYVGTSIGNLAGLANAFASVNNLVDVTTGKVRFTVPGENAAVPFAEIDTLADILNACAVTAGGAAGDGSACGILFGATGLLSTNSFPNAITPSDTLQAAFNIAQHPVSNYGYALDSNHVLFPLITSDSPFQPTLPTRPSDWSISLNYTSGGGISSSSKIGSFAIDAQGDLWITDTNTGSVIEWNSLGVPVYPSNGFAADGGPVAIDSLGNVWISGNGALYELSNLGDPYPWSPYGGVSGGGGEIVIDAQSNLWITNPTGVNEFNDLGLLLSPVNGYTVDSIPNISALEIDSSNNVWLGAIADTQAAGHIAELANPGGQLITQSPVGAVVPQMAADGSGDMWFIDGSLCMAPLYGGKGSILSPTCFSVGASNSSQNSLFTSNPAGIATDGAGIQWVAGSGNVSGDIPPSIIPIKTSSTPTSAQPYASSSLAAGTQRVAIDGSGNVWVLLANNTITEYVGAAAPTVAPLAVALERGKIGKKP